MNPPSAALLEQPAVWSTAAPVSATEGAGVESDPGEWGCPGIGFGSHGQVVIERDEVAEALAESYAKVFARRRQNDADLVHLASISLEITEATASSGTGARIAARRADRDVADSIAEIGLISIHEALHICRVARGITERTTLFGERLPAPYELVREAFETLSIPVDSACAIIVALGEAGTRACTLSLTDAETIENFAAAERKLVEFAQ